jgi:hypothetical protein
MGGELLKVVNLSLVSFDTPCLPSHSNIVAECIPGGPCLVLMHQTLRIVRLH